MPIDLLTAPEEELVAIIRLSMQSPDMANVSVRTLPPECILVVSGEIGYQWLLRHLHEGRAQLVALRSQSFGAWDVISRKNVSMLCDRITSGTAGMTWADGGIPYIRDIRQVFPHSSTTRERSSR